MSPLWLLALPIIIQNLLAQAIGAADTLMLSTDGQDQLSVVSLANQIFCAESVFYRAGWQYGDYVFAVYG